MPFYYESPVVYQKIDVTVDRLDRDSRAIQSEPCVCCVGPTFD